MSFSQLGIQADSLLQLDDCVGQLSFDTERVTEIVMRPALFGLNKIAFLKASIEPSRSPFQKFQAVW